MYPTTTKMRIVSRAALVFLAVLNVLILAGVVEAQVKVSGRTETSITIEWRPPAPGVEGYYKIWREEVGVSSRKILDTWTDLSRTTYTDTGLESGRSYRYSVELYSRSDQILDSQDVSTCSLNRQSSPDAVLIVIGAAAIVLCAFIAMKTLGNPVLIAILVAIAIAGLGAIDAGATATTLVSPCG